MAKWSFPDHSAPKPKTDYHFIYKREFTETCFVTFQADDLNQAWEQYREEYSAENADVLMVFEGTVTTVHYQE